MGGIQLPERGVRESDQPPTVRRTWKRVVARIQSRAFRMSQDTQRIEERPGTVGSCVPNDIKNLRLCYVTRHADPDSVLYATQSRWIREYARLLGTNNVTVILQEGRLDNADISVQRCGTDIYWPWRFILSVHSLRHEVDLFLVSQGGKFPLLLQGVRVLGRKPIIHWRAHSVLSPKTRWALPLLTDCIITVNSASLPISRGQIRQVGHGIDLTEIKFVVDYERSRRILILGRVTPIKNVELAFKVIATLNLERGKRWKLDLVGPVAESYRARLETEAHRLGIQDDVTFVGAVARKHVPRLFSQYELSLSLSGGAVDKAALECLAAGLPVISTNAALQASFTEELFRELTPTSSSGFAIAELVKQLNGLDGKAMLSLRQRCRNFVEDEHSLDLQAQRVVDLARSMVRDKDHK